MENARSADRAPYGRTAGARTGRHTAERPAGGSVPETRGPMTSSLNSSNFQNPSNSPDLPNIPDFGDLPDGRPLRVAVVDDHRLIWSALTMVLQQAGQQIVAVAASVDALAGTPDPDVVVCELHLPRGPSGTEAVRRLVGRGRRVLVMSGTTDPEMVLDAVEAGAGGFVEKSEDPDCFVTAVAAVGRDGFHVSARLAGYLLEDLRRRPLATNDLGVRHLRVLRALARGDTAEEVCRDLTVSRADLAELVTAALEAGRRRRRRYRPSPREREVMTLLACEGLSRKEIADRLGIASWTVTSTLENLRGKYVRLHPEVARSIRPSAAALLWAMKLRLCERASAG